MKYPDRRCAISHQQTMEEAMSVLDVLKKLGGFEGGKLIYTAAKHSGRTTISWRIV